MGKALLPWHAHCQPLREDRPSLDAAALEADLAAATKVPLEPAHIQLFPEGSAALAVLEHLIDTASGRIDVLMYLWDSDDLGRAVAEHLACWARKGRPVRVLVDGGGNLLHGDPRNTTCSQVNRVVNWLAHQPNVQVLRTRNPLARFDHRKLVLVDGRIAWTGGRNFCRAAFEEEHDLTVTVEGPLVNRMCATFEKFWREQGGKPLPCLCWCPPAPPVDPYVNAEARLVSTAPGQRDLLKTICIAVNHACHHIYLENPYPGLRTVWLKNEPRAIGKSCLWLNLTHCGGSRSWLLNLLTTLTYGSSVRNSCASISTPATSSPMPDFSPSAPWNDPYVSSLTLLPSCRTRGLLCTSVTRSKPS